MCDGGDRLLLHHGGGAEQSTGRDEQDFILLLSTIGALSNIDRLTRPLLTELIEQITVNEDGALDITFRFRDAFEEAMKAAREKSA